MQDILNQYQFEKNVFSKNSNTDSVFLTEKYKHISIDDICFCNQVFKKEVILELKRLYDLKIISKEEIVLGMIIYARIIETNQNLNTIFQIEEQQKVLDGFLIDPKTLNRQTLYILIAARNLSDNFFFNRRKFYKFILNKIYTYKVGNQIFKDKTEEEVLSHLGYIPNGNNLLNIKYTDHLTGIYSIYRYIIYKKNEMSEDDFIKVLDELNLELSKLSTDIINSNIVGKLLEKLNLRYESKIETIKEDSPYGENLNHILTSKDIGSFYLETRNIKEISTLIVVYTNIIPANKSCIITNPIKNFKNPQKEFLLFSENHDILLLKKTIYGMMGPKKVA